MTTELRPILKPNGKVLWPHIKPGYYAVALGNGSQFYCLFGLHEGGWVVGVEGYGCYHFSHRVDWAYLGSKLKMLEGDAKNMSDLINHQWDLLTQEGDYMSACCNK